MKVPKVLLKQLIKSMCRGDEEKQQAMLDTLDKLNLDELQSVDDVAKLFNNPEAMSALSGSTAPQDGLESRVDNNEINDMAPEAT